MNTVLSVCPFLPFPNYETCRKEFKDISATHPAHPHRATLHIQQACTFTGGLDRDALSTKVFPKGCEDQVLASLVRGFWTHPQPFCWTLAS